MSHEDQLLDLKDSIVAAFRPVENLFGSWAARLGTRAARWHGFARKLGKNWPGAFASNSMPPWTGWQPRDTTADVARDRPGILVYRLR